MAALGSSPARYPSPIELAVAPDGRRLYVVCEGTDELRILDAHSGAMLACVPVGRVPKGIALSTDGQRAYVANSWSDTIAEIDTGALSVMRSLRAGFEPTSAVVIGRTLYAANRISSDVSVIDLDSGEERKRLVAGRGVSYLSLSPDGRRIYATHVYPNPGPFRAPPESEITVIDAGRQVVIERHRLPGAAGVFHSAITAGGRLGVAAQMRPKNLIPLAHVAHGWVIGNGIAVFGDEAGGVVQLSIDELDRYYTPPFAVAVAGDFAYLSTTGSDSVTVVDLRKAVGFIRETPPEQRARLANDLSASSNYVAARIAVGSAPKGMALSPDGSRLYVANRNDDTISVIDTALRKVAATLRLDGSAALTPERRGERLFYSARFAYQRHFGCANCHIEGTFDGLSWDLEPDGFGIDIVDNRMIEDVAETAPFKWNGGNPDLETECGPRTERFFYRAQSYSREELHDLVRFLKAMPPRPNRFRPPGGELTAQQERGRLIFERTKTRSGAAIDESNQCPVCHAGSRYTNQSMTDAGTSKPTDRSPLFDVPQLTNVALSAPYLHDGSANSLEEIWTVFNPNDTHGVTNDLAKDELNDLIEYLKTL
jgi:YVTN family beta-propeller protein